jgi:hypothetical protein
LQSAQSKELKTTPPRGVGYNPDIPRCIHRFPDGTPCCAPAVARSTRCRHHQLDLRRRARLTHAATATRAYRRSVVAAQGLELLELPFTDALRRLDKFRRLGFITPTHARNLRYGLQIHAQIKREQRRSICDHPINHVR